MRKLFKKIFNKNTHFNVQARPSICAGCGMYIRQSIINNYYLDICSTDCLEVVEELPELPKGLEILNCNSNNLKELPRLPKRLKYFFCFNNNLPYISLEGYWKWFYKENPDLGEANKMKLF